MERVLVVGATGNQGAAQVAALLASGHSVLAATRGTRSASLPPGARKVRLDLLEPDSLFAAMAGVDTVFLNLPSASFTDPETILLGSENLLAAAKRTRPRRIVFNASLYVGERTTGHVSHDTRLRIVRRLLETPIDATIVCPVIFMENMLQGWALPALRDRQVLSYPHADDLAVSWISLADVARIMMTLAARSDAIDQRFVVGGPEALRGPETAAALSRAWGREIRFESLPVEQFAYRMASLLSGKDKSAPARIARDLEAVYRWYNGARPSPFTVEMKDFMRRYALSLQSVEEWARAHPVFESSARNPMPYGDGADA